MFYVYQEQNDGDIVDSKMHNQGNLGVFCFGTKCDILTHLS